MVRGYAGSLRAIIHDVGQDLLHSGVDIHRGEWQAMDTAASEAHKTKELVHVSLCCRVPLSVVALVDHVQPDLPWAEDQFEERVSGRPWNPGETYKDWPHHKGDDARHRPNGQFSHTYGERYFPRFAGQEMVYPGGENVGVRYQYGDLNNLVHSLVERPLTRQAVLPVWFPEDLHAADVEGERVPCTLYYQFLGNGEKLDVIYTIRSCDYVRHFRNDVYMTCRLLQWVVEQVEKGGGPKLEPGRLVMHIGSLHAFFGDLPQLKKMVG